MIWGLNKELTRVGFETTTSGDLRSNVKIIKDKSTLVDALRRVKYLGEKLPLFHN